MLYWLHFGACLIEYTQRFGFTVVSTYLPVRRLPRMEVCCGWVGVFSHIDLISTPTVPRTCPKCVHTNSITYLFYHKINKVKLIFINYIFKVWAKGQCSCRKQEIMPSRLRHELRWQLKPYLFQFRPESSFCRILHSFPRTARPLGVNALHVRFHIGMGLCVRS